MANNAKTAEEWKQVAAETQVKLDKYQAERAVAVEELAKAKADRDAAKAQLDQARAATGNFSSPEATAARKQYNQLNGVFNSAETRVKQYNELISNVRTNVANANAEAEKAAAAPPKENSVVQPAGDSTNANSNGSNTSAGPATPPPVAEQQGTVNDADPAARQSDQNATPTPPATPGAQPAPVSSESNPTPPGETTPTVPVTNATVPAGSDPAAAPADTPAPAADATPAAGTAPSVTTSPVRTQTLSETVQTINRQRSKFEPAKDWRFRMSLAPGATYLYKAANAGILAPLKTTDGVIFPYSPAISVNYAAAYDTNDLPHSNYKMYTYKGSSVESITIGGDFTAQDSVEANYLLAVIHFFRSATKMFYGQDENPARGVPPPLVYMSGFGQYQFDNHPVAITGFTYTMPTDVDYINAYPSGTGTGATGSAAGGGFNLSPFIQRVISYSTPLQRLTSSFLKPGGIAPAPVFTTSPNIDQVTRVPTKISISLTCIPIVTRNAISNEFSLAKYATGSLLQGSKNPNTGGGIW